jgi:hypothetical protein
MAETPAKSAANIIELFQSAAKGGNKDQPSPEDGYRLIKAFLQIESAATRRSLLEIAESLAKR